MDKQPVFSRKQLGGLVVGGIAIASTASAFAQSAVAMPVPVSGGDAFEILEADHKRIGAHIKRLIIDVEGRRDTLDALSALFTVHNATEENYVYPAVGKIAKLPEDSATLFHQQDEAKTVVWTLHEIGKHQGFASPRFTETAETLLHAATAHVHLEETREFPMLRVALGSKGVADLTHEVRAFRRRFA